MNQPAYRWQLRLFRLLVRVSYPAWLRRAHGSEMEEWFVSHLARERGVRARLGLWKRVGLDAARTATEVAGQRVSERRPPAQRAGRIDMLWQDIRHAARHLTRTPLFTVSSIALLAIGLAANIGVFAVADRLLVRTLPYADPGDVVFIYQDDDEGEPSRSAFPAYRDIAATSGVFSAVTATSPSRVTFIRDGNRETVTIEYTTASYIDVAGRAPQLGRWLSREADVVGGPLEAVISDPVWRTKFGANPAVLGQSVRLNDQFVTIVGVGPAGLPGSFAPVVTDFWVSISSTSIDGPYRVANLELREDHWYDVRARLADGVTPESAQHAMAALATALGEAHPDVDRGRDLTVRRATDVQLFPETENALMGVGLVAALLLILGIANLANLLLVRAIGRSGETAVRRALGANGTRLARLHVIEALILTVTGALAGLWLARMALDALSLVPLPPELTAAMASPLDSRILFFAAGVALACGILLGLAPAWRATRGDVIGALRDDRRTSSSSPMTMRLRSGLVTVQVAGSLVLLVAAGLLARSLGAMLQVDPGVDADRVAFVDMTFGGQGQNAGAQLEEVFARLTSLPGITHAAAASRLPAQRSGTTTTIVEGYTPPSGTGAVELGFTIVSPGYFDTVGLALLDGRGFTWDDAGAANPVVIVNRSAARQFWGTERAIGRRLRSQSRPDFVRTVVGVVEDAPVTTYPERSTPPIFYAPIGRTARGVYILARTNGDAAAQVSTIATAIAGMRSTFEVDGQGTLASHLGGGLTLPRTMARVMGVVSLVALTLAALGIYAVVAFNVARRTTEIGIRIALGATAPQVIRMVLVETSAAVALGLACGIGLAALAVPQLGSVLFGVRALDPAAFAGGAVVLAIAAWLAAYLPAKRAAATDPAMALRTM